MEIEKLKDEILKFVGDGKVTFTKKVGKRNKYIFSVGKTSFSFQEKIYEDENFIVFSENLAPIEKEEILNLIKGSL